MTSFSVGQAKPEPWGRTRRVRTASRDPEEFPQRAACSSQCWGVHMKQGGISPERQRRLAHTPRGPPSSSHRAPASRHSALGAGRTYSPRSQPREAARSAQTKGREIQVGIARNVSAGRPTASSPKWMRVSTRSGWSGSWEFELPGGCNQGVHPRADPGAPVAIPPKPHPHGGVHFRPLRVGQN